ncbi:hypothetical protein LSH36_1181g00024 [Paralvinella palmiformis]|uniref:Uncharacterized protein n=1 Tax=Paralvinella palmiformis TaxID=53620 RepID=A0AAD9MR28_9ANNE|nr:hypothetical protein LSH36_1181g00024 [Paralvinella palmiformis]
MEGVKTELVNGFSNMNHQVIDLVLSTYEVMCMAC